METSTKIPYSDLVLMPDVIATIICDKVYTGDEYSNPPCPKKTEKLRKAMTPEQKQEFINFCNLRCQEAYEIEAEWFMKCVNAEGNKGRDQLMVWISHWLAAYLRKINK